MSNSPSIQDASPQPDSTRPHRSIAADGGSGEDGVAGSGSLSPSSTTLSSSTLSSSALTVFQQAPSVQIGMTSPSAGRRVLLCSDDPLPDAPDRKSSEGRTVATATVTATATATSGASLSGGPGPLAPSHLASDSIGNSTLAPAPVAASALDFLPAASYPPLKPHLNTPEGKYQCKLDAIYIHPSGRLLHFVRWMPVRVSFITYKHKRTGSGLNGSQLDLPSTAAAPAPATAPVAAAVAVDDIGDDDVPHFKATSEPTHSSTVSDDGSQPANASNSAPAAAATTATAAAPPSQPTPALPSAYTAAGAEGDAGGVQKKKSFMSYAKSMFKGLVKSAIKPAEKPKDGFFKEVVRPFPLEGTCIVYNIGRTLVYHDYFGARQGIFFKTPIELDVFVEKTYPSCHDFNQLTRGNDALELVIGISTGALLVKDSISNVVKHINQDLSINKSKVTNVRWVPGSETLFLASYLDGDLIVFDKDRSDPVPLASNASSSGGSSTDETARLSLDKPADLSRPFTVLVNPSHKHNPVSTWRIGRGPVNDFAFSPDCKHLATVSRDGGLRVFDFESRTLLMEGKSYFGALLSAAWSPDGKYILTGGEDDLVSLWSFFERRLVAKGEGHTSWVSAVAFDPFRSDNSTYRFGSGGQDTKLLLWEYTVPSNASKRQKRDSVGDAATAAAAELRSAPAGTVENLSPFVSQKAHHEAITSLVFREEAVVTSCQGGMTKLWLRPAH